MLNQVVLVGRLVNNPELVKEDEKNICNITLAIPTEFKNADGEYETDFVPVVVWNGIALNLAEYCHKGDLVGVKGKVKTQDEKLVVVAEKITFLSSKKADE